MANYTGSPTLDDVMGSGTVGSPGTATADRWSSGGGNDTFVYELATMNGADRYSGGTGKDTVEFRLTAAEWANATTQANLIAFKAAVDAKVLTYKSGELDPGVGYTPLSFGIGKNLTVLEAENVRVYANNVLVLGTAPPTTVGTVKEAGVDLAYAPLPGTPQATGFMPQTDSNGDPIPAGSTWSFVGVNGGPFSPDIYSKLGTGNTGFSITAAGQWTYTLDNTDVDTQDLQNGVTKTMSFKVGATDPITNSTVFNNVTITLNGTNDIQTVVVTGSDFAVSERGGVGNTTVGPDGDGASGAMALTNVDNTPIVVPVASFEGAGSVTMKGTYGDLLVTRVGPQATSVLTDDLTNATWSYTLRNGDANVQALTAGQKVVDPVMLTASLFDGASNVISINITGADDAAVISGGTQDTSVIESGGIQDGNPGDPNAGGTFTQTDPDTLGPYTFAPLTNTPLTKGVRIDNSSTQGVYGTFSLNTTTGAWTYLLDNTRPATQALQDNWTKLGEIPVTELLTVASSTNPGATATITVNVFGRDDLTQAINNVYDKISGQTVDEAFGGDTTAGGALTRVDIDGVHVDFSPFGGPVASVPGDPIIIIGGKGTIPAIQTFQGQYGDFALDGTSGLWTYTRNDGIGYLNSEELITGQFGTDVMLVRSNDFGAQKAVSVTIIGLDDAPVFGNDNMGIIVEAGGPRVNTLPGVPTAKGTYTVTDEDLGQGGWAPANPAKVAGIYGDFTFNTATGDWTYTLDNARTVTEQLTAGQKTLDKMSLTSIDGTSTSVTVNITGTNDHAIITVTPTPDLNTKEAGGVANGILFDPNANGDLDVADVDGVGPFSEARFRAPTPDTNNFAVLTDQVGVYGNFSFNANTGTWTYVLNNFDITLGGFFNNYGLAQVNALQALADGVTVTDSMLVYSEDLSASTVITVNVTGSYDVASITNVPNTDGSEVKAEGTWRTTPANPATAIVVTPDYLAGGNLNPVAPSVVDTYNAPAPAQLIGVYGQFTFNAGNGVWTYTLDNEDPDTLALVAAVSAGKHVPSAQDFLTVSNTAAPTEVYTIAVDVFGAFTAVDLKANAQPTGLLQTPNTLGDLVPNAAPVVKGAGGLGSITFIVRNGDPGEVLSLHAGNPQPTPAPWGTVTVNDGTLTTVTMPATAATAVPGVINQILHVWDGDTQTASVSPAAALSLGLSIAQGTDASDVIVMIGNGGMASGYDGNDNITGTAFNDFIDGGRNSDTVSAGDGNDTVVGGDGNDLLDGGNNNDVLWGGAGDDTLLGQNGNDTMIGGPGRDTMTGDGGASDTYFFGTGPFNSVTDDDTITDFIPAADKLWFTESLLTSTGYQVAALPAATSISSNNWFASTTTAIIAGQTYAADDRFIFDNVTGQLYYDADGGSGGAGLPILVATLQGAPALGLTAADFVINALSP